MIRAGLAAVLLLFAAAAGRAELAMFDAGPLPPNGTLYSADGYHFAYLESDEHEDRWMVDGRARERADAGTLAGPGALSADGSVLFHFLNVAGGLAPAINGRRVGKKVYTEIGELKLSPSGRNAAFAARTAEGWVVVSGEGTGPAFKDPPRVLAVSEESTAYIIRWSGANWLYRDHRPVRAVPYDTTTFSPDLKRMGGIWKRPDNRFNVELDGERTGPWTGASAPAFSSDGRHAGYCIGRPPSWYGACDHAVVDGVETAITPCLGCSLLIGDDGRAFEDKTLVAVDERAQIHDYSVGGRAIGRGPTLGISADGAHYGLTTLMGGNGFVMDGKVVESGAPLALAMRPPVFVGAEEYHYWSLNGKNLLLVCGALDGTDPAQTRCASAASAAGWNRVSAAAPPSAPADAP